MAFTTIDNAELYFQTKIYSGTGSSLALTLDGTENMSPNLIWLKRRSAGGIHFLYDSVWGANKALVPKILKRMISLSRMTLALMIIALFLGVWLARF